MGVKLFKYFGRKYKILILFEGTAKALWTLCSQVNVIFQEAHQQDFEAYAEDTEVMGLRGTGFKTESATFQVHDRASHFLISRTRMTITPASQGGCEGQIRCCETVKKKKKQLP